MTTSELLPDGGRGEVAIGFPIGFKAPSRSAGGAEEGAHAHEHHHHHEHEHESGGADEDSYYVYNHLSFKVLLHRAEAAALPRQPSLAAAAGFGDAAVLALPSSHDAKAGSGDQGWLVVGFEVEPCSVDREALGGLPPYDPARDRDATSEDPAAAPRLSHPVACSPGAPARVAAGQTLAFTYSVRFEESAIPWNQRWDAYVNAGTSDEVHWFSILNSMCASMDAFWFYRPRF